MNIAMMQPAFLPWQGYFELIYKSDCFIFLDDFQFSVQSYHQRNRLFVNKGQVDWYSVPIKKSVSFKSPLNQTQVNEATPWREKFWKRLEANYSKTVFWGQLAPDFKECLFSSHRSLGEQNIILIKLICRWLGIEQKFLLSSEFPSSEQRSSRVLELLRHLKATRYYCARGAFEYMLEDAVFPVNDIEVLFQNFIPKPYSQIGSEGVFIPSLSVIDALMNVGPEQTAALIRKGTDNWQKWEELITGHNITNSRRQLK